VYPNAAKQQGIEGPVELEAVIGKDGTVREVKPVSGDALLSAAAADAVRQWQFKPYAPEGSPVEFRTALKLNFSLP
jgi:protein TonB